jgi:hypothetical protein
MQGFVGEFRRGRRGDVAGHHVLEIPVVRSAFDCPSFSIGLGCEVGKADFCFDRCRTLNVIGKGVCLHPENAPRIAQTSHTCFVFESAYRRMLK